MNHKQRDQSTVLSVTNPATGAVMRQLPEDSPQAISAAYARARAAQPRWAATPLDARKRAIAGFRALVTAHAEELARTLTRETGNPIAQAHNEVKGLDARLEFFLAHIDAAVAEQAVFTDPVKGIEERIAHEPLGV